MTTFIKHRPTVLDKLPLEVIREFIFPKLNYEERLNLNQCLPVWDRIPKRMDICSIEKHEQAIVINIIKSYLTQQDYLQGTPKIASMTQLFKLLQKPRFFVIIERNTVFREVVISKIKSLIQGLLDIRAECELGVRLKLASELKKLRDKINISGPYTDCNYNGVLPLSFQ